MTGRDLVSASLRLIGAIAPGESVDSQEATDGLAAINRLIDSWSNENLLIYAITREQFTLVANTTSYTIGSGGDFNTTRPQWIERALIRDDSVTDPIEYTVSLLSNEEYSSIASKSVTSQIPYALYDDGGYPLRTLSLYPTPSAAHKLVLYSGKPLTTIASLDTSLSLPPGYERALVYNGALELSPEYGNPIDQTILAIAMDSKASIKRKNHRPLHLRCDDGVIGMGNKFNIFTGDYR